MNEPLEHIQLYNLNRDDSVYPDPIAKLTIKQLAKDSNNLGALPFIENHNTTMVPIYHKTISTFYKR